MFRSGQNVHNDPKTKNKFCFFFWIFLEFDLVRPLFFGQSSFEYPKYPKIRFFFFF